MIGGSVLVYVPPTAKGSKAVAERVMPLRIYPVVAGQGEGGRQSSALVWGDSAVALARRLIDPDPHLQTW
jgi:hypothetical protein